MKKTNQKKTMVYKEKDLILPMLKLPNPCPVMIEISDDNVVLVVGQRDWAWNRKTGKLIGCGTGV
jgi:hypothetical protein